MIVEDWSAEVEDDGFGGGAICVVVGKSVDFFSVVQGIGGGTHIGEKVERIH